uniref:ATP-dependent Clp protease proteolytic subunit n=1 Tax=Solanum lycopersicum TaxID=4081 RepID=A0A3Q7J089_SOLLC
MKKKKRTGISTLIHNFFEPYTSKGACTVPKGYNFTLFNRLYRERLFFLGQGIGTELSNQLIDLMLYLSMEDENKDLYLFVNSPGGWVIPGIAIYDTMQFVRPDIHTMCLRLAASMGSFTLAGGQLTKRMIMSTPNFNIPHFYPHNVELSICIPTKGATVPPDTHILRVYSICLIYI